MIVVDPSAITEFLLQTPLGTRVEARLFRDGDDLHAPTSPASTFFAIHTSISSAAPGTCEQHHRQRAMYVALAEAMDAALVTCDGPLGATAGHAARIDVIRSTAEDARDSEELNQQPSGQQKRRAEAARSTRCDQVLDA